MPDAGGLYDGPAYDGSQDCAPSGIPQTERSCCEGVPCYGSCQLHDGAWQCFCHGVDGGCTGGASVCCSMKSGCTAPGECDTTPL
jgi:hypothetical protein